MNAAAREEGLTYNSLRSGLKKASIGLNLKMLAQIAVLDKKTFSKILADAKQI